MKTLVVPFLEGIDQHTGADSLLDALEPLEATKLGEVPWAMYPYHPSVQVKIAHTVWGILLNYSVSEKYVRAVYRNTNDPVYKDSCVEFFLSFDGSNYYNMEFNCLGTALVGYGPSEKEQRRRLPRETIAEIKVYADMSAAVPACSDKEWQLLLHIPLTVFEADAIGSLGGIRCTGNFYKCGDDLPEPHFVAWSRIEHPTPNFHLPQYFGELVFG